MSVGESRAVRWRQRLVPGAAFVFYLLIALEAVIMITPFTVYFYAVYAPVLNRLEAHPWTAWLTAFFLPHITYTGSPVLVTLAWLAPVLLTLGLAVFLACAIQVYSAKLWRRGVVTGGLYRLVRHPQYLGLGVAGLGLLLYWPRFIILLLYLSMLFIYYLLARHEEARMEARFGEPYRRFCEATPMFLGKFHTRPDHSLVAYLVPREYMMQHLIADLGEHEAHHGGPRETGVRAVLGHLGQMYALKPLRQLRDGARSLDRRLIFAEPLTAGGVNVPIARALDADVLRFPLFFAELGDSAVTAAMETPRRHSWGTIPVPAF